MKKHRKMDPASPQYQFCFTGDELLDYRLGRLSPEKRSKVFSHLNVDKCERCRDLYLEVEEAEDIKRLPAFRKLRIIDQLIKEEEKARSHSEPVKLERGQVWTNLPEAKNVQGTLMGKVPISVPVLIIWPGTGEKNLGNIIRVIPISVDTEFVLEGESIVLNESSPLGYPILLEIFNERPMLAGNLGKFRGSVSDGDLDRILAARVKLLKKQPGEQDREYLRWKDRERRLTEYLTFPVNEALWDEGEKTHEIVLQPCRKASDSTGIKLSEIRPHVLILTEEFSLTIIQKRDQVLVEFSSDKIQLKKLMVNKKWLKMKETWPGVFSVNLAKVEELEGEIEITAKVSGDELTFHPVFVRK